MRTGKNQDGMALPGALRDIVTATKVMHFAAIRDFGIVTIRDVMRGMASRGGFVAIQEEKNVAVGDNVMGWSRRLPRLWEGSIVRGTLHRGKCLRLGMHPSRRDPEMR